VSSTLFEEPKLTPAPVILRPYQEKAVAAWHAFRDRGGRRGLIVAATGSGKCLAKGTPVLMFDGSVKSVEKVAVGDLIMGPDSQARRVTSVCSGFEQMYEVTPTKGDSYTVNESHILSLQITTLNKPQCGYKGGEIVNITVSDYLKESQTFRHIAKGYRARIDWPRQGVPIDPYILGCWLGDGHTRGALFTSMDHEVVDAFRHYCSLNDMHLSDGVPAGKAKTYRLKISTRARYKRNPFEEALEELGLRSSKRMPESYLINDRETRLQLLAGLLDTDGHLSNGGFDFITQHEEIGRQVEFLARSLGFAAYGRMTEKTAKNFGFTGNYYRISISGDTHLIPNRVAHKKAQTRGQVKDVLRHGIKVSPVGEGEYFGFTLAGPDRRFVLGDFTVTHNTCIMNAIIRDEAKDDLGFSALAIAHRKELLEQIRGTAEWINPNLPCSIHSGEIKAERGSQIVAASVQSVGQPYSEALSWLGPNLVICDESHHAAADSYQRVFTRFGCYDDVGASLLGVTATPHRLDNKALVGDASKAIFEEIVFRYDIVAAIKDGFLVDLKGYRAAVDIDLTKVKTRAGDYIQSQLEDVMNVDPVNHLAYESWCNAAGGRQTIIFCSGVDHAKAVAEVFNEKGVKAAAVYGDMPMHERISAINAFRDGQIKVLTNMDILTEGFDARECGCVILLRPTKSWSLFTQMVGRGLRTLPGVIDGIEFEPSEQRRSAIQGSRKPDCVVIDIVGLTGAHQVNERKNGDGEPSLNALVGLPEGLDLEGKTVVEALEAFEELPEIVKAAAARKRKLNFSELTAVLSQVEMLSEIESPEEACDSDLYWLKTGDLSYRLDCGSDRPEEGEAYGVARSATLQGDILGNWQLLLKSKHRNETHDMPDDLQQAFMVADGIIRKTFYGVANLASKKAAWRLGEPTPPQRQFLQAKGIDPAVVAQLTKGSASAMIGLIKGREATQ
jgi:superfamily II DNA or RNA helicase